jgi:hypothetical protein
MRLPDEFVEEHERRKQLLSAAANGNGEAQNELQREYRVRVFSAVERAKYKYAEVKSDRGPYLRPFGYE